MMANRRNGPAGRVTHRAGNRRLGVGRGGQQEHRGDRTQETAHLLDLSSVCNAERRISANGPYFNGWRGRLAADTLADAKSSMAEQSGPRGGL